jgi:SAM-dependent methyltransferase
VAGSPYAEPRTVTDAATCYFYHTMDIPGHGLVQGEWDLREGIDDYLGCVQLKGKRVLEVGTASGFVCFEMERRGAEVVAVDLDEDQAWDVVPFAQYDHGRHAFEARVHLQRLHNAWWFGHRALQSKARVVYGSVYALPDEIGQFDVATFGCVLLHLRDPFLALSGAAQMTKETIVVTEPVQLKRWSRWLLGWSDSASAVFLPDAGRVEPKDTWWSLQPKTIVRMLGVLGFEKSELAYHRQKHQGQWQEMYTVVGYRTREMNVAAGL